MSDIRITSGGEELLDRVEPLWLELRQHHADLAPTWRAVLLSSTFENRKAGLRQKASGGGTILVLLAIADDVVVAYCISTVTAAGGGEVDSLYVLPAFRRRGVARALMSRSMDWLRDRATGGIAVDVMAGNEDALRLYTKYGFHVRTVRMVIPQ